MNRRDAVKATAAAGVAAIAGTAKATQRSEAQRSDTEQRDYYLWLTNVRCWDPSGDPSFSLTLPKTDPILIGPGMDNEEKWIQIGPYQVKVEIKSEGDAEFTISTGGPKFSINFEQTVHGSVFQYQDDVRTVGFDRDGKLVVRGHAKGCFDIEW